MLLDAHYRLTGGRNESGRYLGMKLEHLHRKEKEEDEDHVYIPFFEHFERKSCIL